MKEVNVEFGEHNFNARQVISKPLDAWMIYAKQVYPSMSDDEIKAVHAESTKAVDETDNPPGTEKKLAPVKPAPNKP